MLICLVSQYFGYARLKQIDVNLGPSALDINNTVLLHGHKQDLPEAGFILDEFSKGGL
jgi:hypothetical protein